MSTQFAVSAASKVALMAEVSTVPETSRPAPLTLPLAAIAATLVATLALVFWTGAPEPAATVAAERLPAIAERDVFFEDVTDGSVRVIDARLRTQVELIAPASNGFLRGAMRGLVRERKRQSIGPEVPFTIAALATGRVVLRDPATAREIDLASFGSTNADVFARLLAVSPNPKNATQPATSNGVKP
jgi:putative photosynthetic complex assembly protein